MDGHKYYHTKWNKANGERQISYDITYVWNLKKDIFSLFYKTERDSQT